MSEGKVEAANPGRLQVWAVALGLTLLNALKPPTVDDLAYLEQAARWAAHPGDPLGGTAVLYQSAVPAARVASPPVAVAWLALGTGLLGESWVALKLWLLPWALLLASALAALLRRIAPSHARLLLVMVVLSPAVLPSFNFMLDVPELALVLAALAVFARGIDLRDLRLAAAAGALAGLAMQARYDALPVLAGLACWGAGAGSWRAAAWALAAAAASFGLIEAGCAVLAHASPLAGYLAGRAARDPRGLDALRTARKLLRMAGSAGVAVVPLALAAAGAPRALSLAIVPLALAAFLFLALAPEAWVAGLDRLGGGPGFGFENLALGWMGVALALAAIALAVRLLRRRPGTASSGVAARALLAWCAAEAALAPFISASASVRRVIGVLVALTLAAAAGLEEAAPRPGDRRRVVAWATALSAVLGLFFWGADLDSALSERRALDRALAIARAAGSPDSVACVADHWGAFQAAARERGLPRLTEQGPELPAGAWLLVPFGVEMRGVALDATRLARVDSVPLSHHLPLTTRRSFYDGRHAIRRVDPFWVGARLYRVTRAGPVLREGGAGSASEPARP